MSAKFQCEIESMPNKEDRLRIVFERGARVVIVTSDVGGWQDSATMVREDGSPVSGEEFVVVQTGWAAVATYGPSGVVEVRLYREGEKFTIDPNRPHNTYLSAGGRIVAIISGDWRGVTRRAEPALDRVSKRLTVDDIVRLAAS